MTENEAIRELECWLNFRFRTQIAGIQIAPELVNATRMATEALREVQQYRKHEITVESALNNMCDLTAAENLIEEYRAIGTLEDLNAAIKYIHLAKKHGTIGQVIENCVKYEEIGTPEECKEAVEKQTAKKPYIQQEEMDYCFECPSCDSFIGYEVDCKDEHYRENYCPNCGQKLDWSDVLESNGKAD